MPEKLVTSVNGATETSVTLPTVSGVTWASADTATATVSGNTLTLIPSEEGTKEAKVTATFTENSVNYVKTYKMTLAKAETTPEPEPEPEPDPEPGEEVEGIVSVDKTFNYASATEALADGWKVNDDAYRELTVDENGYVKYNQIKQSALYTKVSEGVYGANNGSGTSSLMYSMPKGTVAIDEENGTKIINETGKYIGKLQVEVDVEMDMKPATAYYLTEDGKSTGTPLKDGENDIVDANGNAIQVRQPQFNLTFAPNVAIYRLRPSSQNYINNGTEGSSTITNNSNGLGFIKGNTHKIIMTVDTDADTTTGTIAGAPNVAEGPTIKDTNYFLQLQLSGFQRMEVGSNFTFKGVKVITKEAGYGPEGTTIVAQLPEKLVADVTNVTEATVTLPSIEGVTWTSVDTSAATISGNTVTFIPSENGTKVAEIKAAFTGDTANNIKFSKYYTMILAEAQGGTDPEPDPEPTPDDSAPEWVKYFGAKKVPGNLVDSHGFSDSDVAGRKVYNAYTDGTNFSGTYTANGFELKRVSAFTSGTGNAVSNELMRINFTKKVEEEYQYNLEGLYVMDLTVNGSFTSIMKLYDVYLDGYMVSSGEPDSLSTGNDTNVKAQFIAELGKTGNTFFQLSSKALFIKGQPTSHPIDIAISGVGILSKVLLYCVNSISIP